MFRLCGVLSTIPQFWKVVWLARLHRNNKKLSCGTEIARVSGARCSLWRLRSFKVTDFGTNWHPISHRLPDIVKYWSNYRFWQGGGRCLSLTNPFSETSENVAISHILQKNRFLCHIFDANCVGLSSSIFSERELMFMFAICRRPSVCLSSVCRLQRSCTLLWRLKFSAMFLRHLVPWPSMTLR